MAIPYPAKSFTYIECCSDRGEQTDRHEFKGDQGEDAECHGEDSAPVAGASACSSARKVSAGKSVIGLDMKYPKF